MFSCEECNRSFTKFSDLRRHVTTIHAKLQSYDCNKCSKRYTRRDNLLKHVRVMHASEASSCIKCRKLFHNKLDLIQHQCLTTHTKRKADSELQPITTNECFFEHREKALRGYLHCYRASPTSPQVDVGKFLNSVKESIMSTVKQLFVEMKSGIKSQICLHIEFEKAIKDGDVLATYFNSKQMLFDRDLSDHDIILQSAFDYIMKSIDNFHEKGSGWVIKNIKYADVHFARRKLTQGSCQVSLPTAIRNKYAVVNVDNKDDKCFMWAVLASLYPCAKDPQRVSKYTEYANVLNFEGISFPVAIKDINKFELLNNICVNVYDYDDGVSILRLSKTNYEKRVNLFLYNGHYCTVRSIDRLLGDSTNSKEARYYCEKCLFPCRSEVRKLEHMSLCNHESPSRVVLPAKDNNILQFINVRKMLRAPYVVYADLESLTEKVHTCSPDPKTSYTNVYQMQTPCSYGYVEAFGCCDNVEFGNVQLYTGHDCIEKFLEKMLHLGRVHQERLSHQLDLKMTGSDWQTFQNATTCHICGYLLGDDRHRDHCHIDGKFRGAAHAKCNMQYQLSRDMTVVFHNLRGYDGHLLMKKIGTLCAAKDGIEIECLPRGLEDYLSFAIVISGHVSWRIRFIDSCQFLMASLEQLAQSLQKESMHAIQKHFDRSELELVMRKGVFPYDFMDSWSKLQEVLPSKDAFYSQLNDTHISDSDYSHALNVYNVFNMQNMQDYLNLYLTVDILLLADVFENFRKFSLTNYQLDPVHYFTLPGLGWDACLKMSNVQLELITDIDMYTFLESGIRGGVSMISHRYSKANNPYLDNFDERERRKYIMYLDANNLYGYSMLQRLPKKDFRWLDKEEYEGIDWLNTTSDDDTGYILEVDLKYPEKLHDSHNGFPLAPERKKVTVDMLSPYAQQHKIGSAAVEKLTPNLYDKEKYIVYSRNLKLYLELGLELVKVHRVLAFTQEAWMTKYITFNTDMRKRATCDFEKGLYKLLNNSVFGKTIENTRAYMNVKIVSNDKKFAKLVGLPRYKGSSIFSEELVAVSMERATTVLNKPIYAGFVVLELAKELMYDFYYNFIVNTYGNNAKLLGTDTDSLILEVSTNDFYKDMVLYADLFDTSDYDVNHFAYNDKNKKVVGKMKDEMNGIAISEFVGLRPKMYSLLFADKEKKVAKGVKKCVVKKVIQHDDYKNVLFNNCYMRNCMKYLRSDDHTVRSIVQNKISLSCYDDKRYLNNNIDSYAYGHYKI